MAIKPPRRSKNPPVMSHEFIIQNHGDIVSCVAMVIVMGLMFQVSSPLASLFIILQHTITPEKDASPEEQIMYTNGSLDFAAIFFYGLIAVVVHAIVQEYLLDRVNRKLHLSKTKHSLFNESGQLLIFNICSVAWGLHILFKDETVTRLSSLWAGYPEEHVKMSFRLKFYFIAQIAYWIHSYPELYFQKVKREEMFPRILSASLHLVFISAAYALNFTHIALVLLSLHYTLEGILHASRLLHFAEITSHANQGFNAYNILFPILRLVSLMLTVLTFMMGLSSNSATQGLDTETGNFNTPLIRLLSVGTVSAIQGWMVWRFVTFHLRQKRLKQEEIEAANKKKEALSSKITKKVKKGSDEDDALLPEADQKTRHRK